MKPTEEKEALRFIIDICPYEYDTPEYSAGK